MTKREAAIVAAYTGILIGEFSVMHAYIEEKLGGPIWSHQFPERREEIKNVTRGDFLRLNVNLTGD